MNFEQHTYDDFLGLSSLDVNRFELIVLSGISGSGKSSAMEFLSRRSELVRLQACHWIEGEPLPWNEEYDAEWLLVDEVVRWADLLQVRRLLERGHRIIMASHLPDFVVRFGLIGFTMKLLRTDGQSDKLLRYLERNRINFDQQSLAQFTRYYGQSYNTMSVMLEYSGVSDLSLALKQFQRQCRMTLTRG